VNFPPESLYFMKQVITNACATQAILSILLNMLDKSGKTLPEFAGSGFDAGETLTNFREFTNEFDSQTKGIALSNSDLIKNAHNSFHKQSFFEIVHDDKDEKEDAFHFISYVPHNGTIYELDGLKDGPINVGTYSKDTPNSWLKTVVPEVQKRMQSYGNEVKFNLLAVVPNKLQELEKKALPGKFHRQRLQVKLISMGEEADEEDLDDDLDDDDCPAGVPDFDSLPDDVDELQAEFVKVNTDLKPLLMELQEQKKIHDKWTRENRRRKHDYTAFALCCLRHLAKQGKLMPMYEKAKVEALAKKEADKKAEAAK